MHRFVGIFNRNWNLTLRYSMDSKLSSIITGRNLFTTTFMRLCLLLFLFVTSTQAMAAQTNEEYKLKVALIYKLTKFIDWPDLKQEGSRHSFGICLLGEDRFGEALDALQARKVGDLPIVVYRHTQSEAIDDHCQIAFISESKQAFLKSILQTLQGAPILTLSDIEGFATQGGIVQFTYLNKRIGFVINQESAKASHLTIASPLLDLATLVNTKSQATKE